MSRISKRTIAIALMTMLAAPFTSANAQQTGACGIIPQGFDSGIDHWMHGGVGDPYWESYHNFENWDNLHPGNANGAISEHSSNPHSPLCGSN
jgi:hypothetical protein